MKKLAIFLSAVILLLSLATNSLAASNNVKIKYCKNEFYNSIQEQKEISDEDLEEAYRIGACEKSVDNHYDSEGKTDYIQVTYTSRLENDDNTGSISQVTKFLLAQNTDTSESKQTIEPTSMPTITTSMFNSRRVENISESKVPQQEIILCSSSQPKTLWDDSGGVKCYSYIDFARVADVNFPGFYLYRLNSCYGYWSIYDNTLQYTDKEVNYANLDFNNPYLHGSYYPTSSNFSYSFSYTNYVSDIDAMAGSCGITCYCLVSRGGYSWLFDAPNKVVDNSLL